MAKHKYIFQIELDMEDYQILVKYGFNFEKNFEVRCEDVATELRYYEKEEEKNENQNEID